MNIRSASHLDAESVREVHLAAFDESERVIVSRLAVQMLSEKTMPETINLIAEIKGEVSGHVSFSPFKISGESNFLGYILGPVGIKPEKQKSGVGTKLIEAGIKKLRGMGADVILVYGDPGYYHRFGFNSEKAEVFKAPYKLKYPFGWLGMSLNEGFELDAPVEISCVESLDDPELW